MEIKLKNGGGERNQVSGNFIHPCNLIFTIASQVFDNLCIRRVRQHFYVSGLPDKQLYPSVSAVYGNTEVSMVYLGAPLDG